MAQRSAYAVGGTPAANRHLETGKNIVFHIALGVMVFMRREVGFFNLGYGSLFFVAFGMVMLGAIVHFPLFTWFFGNWIAMGDYKSLARFALVFLGMGLWQRHQRKQEKWNPDRPHGHSLGVSWFADFLPVREDYVYRYIDPAVAALIGALLRYRLGFPLLGFFVMASAGCLCLVEVQLYQQTELNDWGLGDRGKEAQRDGDVLKNMSGQAEARRSSRATHGIPTGSDGLKTPSKDAGASGQARRLTKKTTVQRGCGNDLR